MNVEDHLPLAPRDLLVLAVLAEGPLHGYGIIKSVEARSRSGVLLDPANLYRVLRRMRKQMWIRQELLPADASASDSGRSPSGQSPAGSPDPRRKTYRITSDGKAVLSAELARLERLLKQARPALAAGESG